MLPRRRRRSVPSGSLLPEGVVPSAWRRTGRVGAVGLALGGLLVAGAGAASALVVPAVDPLNLTSEITDEAGVLGDSTDEVQASLDQLASETPYQLYVVYVPDFSGMTPESWTHQTAEASGLGSNDLVLAVGVDVRRYYLAPSSVEGLSSSELQAVAADAEDRLREDDWAGAAIATADGIREAATSGGEPAVASGSSSSSSGGSGFVWFLLIGLIGIGAVFALTSAAARRRRKTGPVITGPGAPGAPQGQPAGDGLDALPTAELDRRSASALVALDDAVRTSEQELGFAHAQFGDQAVAEFDTTLAHAKAQVTEAFRLRQTLDDDVPDTEQQVRATSLTILRLCTQVSEDLDAQKYAFDALRNLQAEVPEKLDAHERAATALHARIDTARAALATLATTYPPTSLESVTHNPDQARLLLEQVTATVGQGRDAVSRGDRGTAVGYARAAEEALGQITQLLDAVDRAGQDLAAAGVRLAAAIESISSDLADVDRLAPGAADVAPRAQDARAAIEQARAAREGGGDPLAALRRITDAEAALDAALASRREAEEQGRRAQAQLGEALGRLDSALRATTDYVDTRRGAIGPEARTRLAEGARLRQWAIDQRVTDPVAALDAARRAEQLVMEAQRLAQADVARADQDRDQWDRRGGGGGGPFNGVGGMILGGILIDSILRGGGGFGGGHHGGGWGGGGDGGGFGDGGFGGGFGDGGSGGGF